MGKGTIYKHFAGKDEIYARLTMDFQRQVARQIQAIDPQLGVLAYLREVIRIFWDTHMASREQHRVLQYCHQDSFRYRVAEATAADMDALFSTLVAPIDAALQRGIDVGLFPAKPLPLLMFGAQAALWGAVDKVWTGCAADESPERYLEEVTRFILAGLMHQDDPTLF